MTPYSSLFMPLLYDQIYIEITINLLMHQVNQKKSSWLFDPTPEHVIRFFNPENETSESLNNLIKTILKTEMVLNYSTLRAAYISTLNQFNIGYNFTYDDITDIPRKKIVEDMIRTLCKIRHDLYPEAQGPNDNEKKLFCSILRITLSLHYEKDPEKNLFKYKQSMIELILPIYHIVWCSFKEEKDIYLIESISKFLFKKFMLETKQIYKLPGSESFKQSIEDFEIAIKKRLDSSICDIFTNNNIPFFIPFKWYSLIFTQEFNFIEVIEVWKFLLNQGLAKFDDNVKDICIHILKKVGKEVKQKKKDKQYILQSLQDISHIGIADIIDKPKTSFFSFMNVPLRISFNKQ